MANISIDSSTTIDTNDSDSSNGASYISDLPFLGYYSLVIVVLGTIFNVLTFIILCRPVFRDTQVRPALHYMRAIAVIDGLGLYGWNLDNYLGIVHGFTLNNSYTVASCKFFGFFNYLTIEASAWLRVFICLDRYLCLSRLQPNTWFNRQKNVLIIIGGTIICFIIFNFHFLLFVCYRTDSGEIVYDAQLFSLYPAFSILHFVVYICIPFLLMISLNSLSVYHLIRLRHTTSVRNSRIRHRAISVTLILTTCLFLVTSTPTATNYAFFYDTLTTSLWGRRIINSFDLLVYTFPILDFPVYLVTFKEFRRELFGLVIRRTIVQGIDAGIQQTQIRQTVSKHVWNTRQPQ